MARSLSIVSLLFCFTTAIADSGGPYVGVPDLKPSEAPPTFAIPNESKPLKFFLTNIPELRWNKQLNEPDSYTWKACTEHHASITSLGHVGGHQVLCVRYISNRRLDQGLDYADMLLLLARSHDTGPAPTLCSPIFYTSTSASVYNHTAADYPAERAGAVVVTRYYDGTGAFRDHIYIRAAEQGFERFTPEEPTK
ncbi:MAG: hypothetical protein KDN18_10700 [Verrucomicrobiae bacterium]|nr:hypothetical protein [Verrucomicrobiae bacterium]